MLFSEVVAASAAVRATRSRKAKIAALAELLVSAGPTEIATVVAWLSGELTQGRIGAGWRTVTGLDTPPSAEASLTVEAVDAVFTQLTGLSGTGSALRRRELLTELFTAATADEQSFLLRLLTGELRQGALTAIVVEALAQATGIPVEVVRRAHMLSGQLPATAVVAITGGEAALRAFRLEVGRPVAPMLASPGGSLDEALAELGPRVSVEHKLDGARIQVHRQGDQVWIFTRTLRDITAGVPELVELVRGLACTSVVLDGETLALTDAGRPRPFQETMSRFATVADTTELLLHPYFFDCLHLDGRDLLDEPLHARRTALELVAGEHAIPALVAPDAEAAAEYYDDALAVGNEGVMIKSLDAPYAAGRRGKSWQKIKPAHTLDLLVIGAEWGYGRRTGFLSNLHLAARDEQTGEPVMVGKTFKGLTDELLRWQTAEFPRYQTGTDGHAVFLRPELVVEIALDGVQTSTRYPGGVALRFARVVRYRPDKEPQQADTIATVRALG
ncbi:ATP-dependent DNA ligase [Nocardia asteroides]|uniref:ATP-dependent DNA ligase n=1 Tax=Nocardia asteroides TaxID=1824 RepID=UPI001E35340C|nr:ATP-dependent DNA ligase [Nocardia asteroides]UGT58108.1 ATP-dependent DNA ligase [Nocardia asteroides]